MREREKERERERERERRKGGGKEVRERKIVTKTPIYTLIN